MNINEYRERTRKKIVCPSGLELQIRKIQSIDYLRMGVMPDVLKIQEQQRTKEIDNKLIEKMNIMFLTRGVIGTDELKIVNKPVNEVVDNELSIEELEEADMQFIIAEVSKFSFGERSGSDLEPFRKEPMAVIAGPDGAALPHTPVSVDEP